jgi:release factor glutamine methyltransferase
MTASATAQTVGDALASTRTALSQAGIDSAALDARLLVAHAISVPVERVIAWPEHTLPSDAAERLERLLARRVAREPMSQILGHREFWSLDFKVTSDVLTPRPDSETVIEAVLEHVGDRRRPLRIVDLGVGSGCLLLALLSELPAASGLGVDQSVAALAIARQNGQRLGLGERVRWHEGDWLDGIDERFDIIVSNPPYIPTAALAALDPELRYEPRAALDGGRDGLDAYRSIARHLRQKLMPGGIVALEIGHDQGNAVTAILTAAGLDAWRRRADLSGRERCILACTRVG